MSTASFNGLLIISVIAVMAPILAASVRRVKLPSAVVEIVAGIIIGPSVLAWVKVDQPVAVVALLGLAFLLFLAGLEVDLRAMTPQSAARSAHRLCRLAAARVRRGRRLPRGGMGPQPPEGAAPAPAARRCVRSVTASAVLW
jgi:predicted Kef-type K+ transport protein